MTQDSRGKLALEALMVACPNVVIISSWSFYLVAQATKIASGPGCCWCHCKRRGHFRSPDVKEVPAPTRCHPTAVEQAAVHYGRSFVFVFFVTSVVCSAGKKPKLEASSTEEPAAGTPSSVKKSPSDSIPGGGEKCIESPDPDRVHGSFKSAEKKTFTVVKKEQPEVKREPSESPKRREGGCGDSGRLQELRDGVQYGRKFWRKGETVTCLARTLQIIERLWMIEILANYFCSVVLILSPDDLLASVYLSLKPAYLAPAYAGVELDMTGTCAMTPPNHDGFNEPVANALSKCEKAFEGEGGGHCVGAEDGVRQPDCTVAAGGRGGLPGGQVFDDAGNTVEVHVGASDQGRSGSVGAIRREGFKCELKYDGDRALFHLLKDGSLELGEQHDAPGRDCPDGPHSEGFAKEYIPGLLNIVGVEQISCLEKAIIYPPTIKTTRWKHHPLVSDAEKLQDHPTKARSPGSSTGDTKD
ncbi:conserved hypothetical protein [Culex quinquefasciatus]|uniref:Uncharacterized protein n=1 Tax=Culex quinquefasciatus TaxID=7176 RepID=B0X475_CULQU|nr:conserved hypothetical protein [Culex quinquefasciatus]|eukprot:XP_001864447.1 conserved hypothetical protein [Culex quinquefasciatus]